MICVLRHVAGQCIQARSFFQRRQSAANNGLVHCCALVSPRLWPTITIVTRNEILKSKSHINHASCSYVCFQKYSFAPLIPLV